jgi:hypothetical protein
MKGSRGGSCRNGLSLARLGVEAKCGQSSADGGRGIVCLARALLATPFGPSAMCFLRTSQCFGSHAPSFSRSAAFQGSLAVSAVQAQSLVCLSLRLRSECFSRSGRPCPLLKGGVMGAGVVLARAFQDWVKPEVDPPRIGPAARGVKWEGHRLACPRFQPRSGVAREHEGMGAGRRAGGSASGLGQAGG